MDHVHPGSAPVGRQFYVPREGSGHSGMAPTAPVWGAPGHESRHAGHEPHDHRMWSGSDAQLRCGSLVGHRWGHPGSDFGTMPKALQHQLQKEARGDQAETASVAVPASSSQVEAARPEVMGINLWTTMG